MRDKFPRPPFRLGKRPAPRQQDSDRIGVIRHRVAARLDGRRRLLVAVAAFLAVTGMAAVATNSTAPGTQPAASVTSGGATGDHAGLAERREAAERADRSAREAKQPAPQEREQASRAAPSEPSPTPTEEKQEEEKEQEKSEPEDSGDDEQAETNQASQADWVHPMPGAATTSCYGMRGGVMHAGVDLAAPPGTPIHSIADGTVTQAGWVYGGYGISVVVDHGNGVLSHYAHASQANVSVGDPVSAGQTVALEGSTGDSTGPHLHFEVHLGGMWSSVEPTGWMRERGVNIGGC